MLANVGFLFLFHIQKGGVGYVGGVKEDVGFHTKSSSLAAF